MAYAAILQVTLGLIFGSAFVAKVRSLPAFRQALDGYQVIPRGLTWPVAVAVVVMEFVLALLLLLNLAVGGALLISSLLLLGFAAVTAVTLRRQEQVQCGCLGDALALRLGWPSAVANLLLAAATVWAFLLVLGAGSPVPMDRLSLSEQVVAYAVGLLAAACYWLGLYAMTVIQQVNEAIEATR